MGIQYDANAVRTVNFLAGVMTPRQAANAYTLLVYRTSTFFSEVLPEYMRAAGAPVDTTVFDPTHTLNLLADVIRACCREDLEAKRRVEYVADSDIYDGYGGYAGQSDDVPPEDDD